MGRAFYIMYLLPLIVILDPYVGCGFTPETKNQPCAYYYDLQEEDPTYDPTRPYSKAKILKCYSDDDCEEVAEAPE